MVYIEDIVYSMRMAIATIFFPCTATHMCVTIFPYEIPEDSIYYPPWKRRENNKRREQEKKETYEKTYSYKYTMTNKDS